MLSMDPAAERFSLPRLALVVAWAAAEATCWPVMPDALLVPLAAARPGTWWRLAGAAMLGTLVGGLASYAVGRHGPGHKLLARLPLVRPAMVWAADAWLAAHGPAGVRHQPLSGLPYKVFALRAGAARLPLGPFLGWSVAVRGARFLAVSGGAALGGHHLRAPVRRAGRPLLGLWAVVFLAGLRESVRVWERRGRDLLG